MDTDTQTYNTHGHRHTYTQTDEHRHTNVQTHEHRHTNVQTHEHRHTHIQTHEHRHKYTDTMIYTDGKTYKLIWNVTNWIYLEINTENRLHTNIDLDPWVNLSTNIKAYRECNKLSIPRDKKKKRMLRERWVKISFYLFNIHIFEQCRLDNSNNSTPHNSMLIFYPLASSSMLISEIQLAKLNSLHLQWFSLIYKYCNTTQTLKSQ